MWTAWVWKMLLQQSQDLSEFDKFTNLVGNSAVVKSQAQASNNASVH